MINELGGVRAKYKDIGYFFGLPPDTLDDIARKSSDNTEALQFVIVEWVRRNYDVERFGRPSWRKVVEAVAYVNELLARSIAKKHLVTSST